ncbi:MAG TPA: DUF4349 domain-containing protein [Dehalococcoidia bacterium]|nr:DUF4349 domain-containing protein [Dehalococcoidia bacterium]
MKKLCRVSMLILLSLILVLITGCAAREVAPPAPSPSPGIVKEYTGRDRPQVAGGKPGEVDADRKIVRRGYMTLEVEDVSQAMSAIAALATELGGYVVSSHKRGNEDVPHGRISIRVPADRFGEVLDRLRKLAVSVPDESTKSQDVTEEYTDLKAQLRNLEATEAQYLELLKKAETVEDTLKVYQALSGVRGEIERVKGRIQYLERTSDMALIEINLQRTKPLGQTGWSALKTLESAVRGLATLGRVLADMAIWLVVFCPVWIPVAVVVIFLWRRRRARASS